MQKSTINITLALFIIILISIASCSQRTCNEDRYEHWLKTLVKRYPVPLAEGQSVLDWWPLRDNLQYNYRITGSKYDFGEKWVNKELTLRIIRDKESESKFHFDIKGFDKFPYKYLIIRGNRIFIGGKRSVQPFIVFPLFKHALFADEEYEFRFLKEAVLKTTERNFFAPLNTEFWQVTEANGNTYRLEQLTPRGLYYIFEKNLGIIKWYIPGGYTVELIRTGAKEVD